MFLFKKTIEQVCVHASSQPMKYHADFVDNILRAEHHFIKTHQSYSGFDSGTFQDPTANLGVQDVGSSYSLSGGEFTIEHNPVAFQQAQTKNNLYFICSASSKHGSKSAQWFGSALVIEKLAYKEDLGPFKTQLDRNPRWKVVNLNKRGSDMKRDAGSVTAIIRISSMQSVLTQGTLTQTHTRARAHTASGHANADW